MDDKLAQTYHISMLYSTSLLNVTVIHSSFLTFQCIKFHFRPASRYCILLITESSNYAQADFYLRQRRRLCFWCGLFVCLSVCPSDYLQTCERILTKFFVGVGHGSRTKWYNFGGDPDHTSDLGVQSPKSGSSVLLTNCVMPCSAEDCALWAYSRFANNFSCTLIASKKINIIP